MTTNPTITAAAYRGYMDLLGAACRMLLLVPVDQLLDHVQRTETLGPILDPAAMSAGGFRRLLEQRRMLEAAQHVRDTVVQLWPEEAAGLLANRSLL